MGAQRLSPKSIRRIERATGLTILRAWAHGGYVMNFVTDDHRHGAWHKTTGEWEFHDPSERIWHYSSCRDLFPESTPS